MSTDIPQGILSDIYHAASQRLLVQGWSPHGDGGSDEDADRRISLEHAVRQGVHDILNPWDCGSTTEEEALRRLGGFLLFTGQADRNYPRVHATDLVSHWEQDHRDLDDYKVRLVLEGAIRVLQDQDLSPLMPTPEQWT